MRKLLKDIADIRVGHTFRGKVQETPDGDVRVLQIKDMRGRMVVTSVDLPLVRDKDINKSYLLEPDDVVMPARGDHYNAALFEVDAAAEEPVVASNQVFILRAKKDQILPGFLCWYLNQNDANTYIKSEIRGTNISLITKESLSKLMVPVPSTKTQQKIVGLMNLWEKEKHLTEQLMQNRETMLKGMFQQLMEQ